MTIKMIGFDADDTLWSNEPFFFEAEKTFFSIFKEYNYSDDFIREKIYEAQMENLAVYGYGIKSYTITLIETAIKLTHGEINGEIINKIIKIGKDMLQKPVDILENVESVLQKLSQKYLLIIVTKGDLVDQERKVQISGLMPFFHHIEIVSSKNNAAYKKLLQKLEIKPCEFFMVGNSLKSDILPVLEIGGFGAHIPFHSTWIHEIPTDEELKDKDFFELKSLNELESILQKINNKKNNII